MSVRPKDAFEAAQSFSLREALSRNDDGASMPTPREKLGLTFNLASVHGQRTDSKLDEPPKQPKFPAELQQVQQFPKSMNLKLNFSEAPKKQAGSLVEQPAHTPALTFSNLSCTPFASEKTQAASKEQMNARADIMRLTAYVDELTSRLKKTQRRLEQTEFQLTRASQVLCKERQIADKTLTAYKQDLALAHETEKKLREEIETSKKKTSLQENSFMSSVGASLASDEQICMQQRNLNELETKVTALGEYKTTLEADVAKLTSLRDSAKKSFEEAKTNHSLETTRVESISAEISVAVKKLNATKEEHAVLLSAIGDAKIEEATVKESVEAWKCTRVRAEEEAAAAKSALQAMLLEHGEMARKLTHQQEMVSELELKEAAALGSLAQTEARLAELSQKFLETQEPEAQPEAQPEPTQAAQDETPSLDAAPFATGCCPRCQAKDDGVSEYESESFESDDESISPPLAPKPAPKRKGKVTGAVAPDRALCTTFSLPVPHMEQSHVAAVAVIDSPLDMTLRLVKFVGSEHALLETSAIAREEDTGSSSNAQEKMINAVVSDLKDKLVEISTSQPVYRPVAPLV